MMNDPQEQAKFQHLTKALVLMMGLTCGLSFWLGGVDFGIGSLVGCFIVAINFYVTHKLAKKLLFDQGSKGMALGAYFLKIALSVLILFIAINKFQVEMLGIFAGLSTIVVASLISSLQTNSLQNAEQDTTEENNNLPKEDHVS